MQRFASRIGSELRESSDVATIRSPYDGSPVGEVAVAGAADVDDAIAAAAGAFETMRRLPTHRRAAVLEGVAARLRERGGELATLMARESGKPIRFCRGEVRRAVVTFTLAPRGARASTRACRGDRWRRSRRSTSRSTSWRTRWRRPWPSGRRSS